MPALAGLKTLSECQFIPPTPIPWDSNSVRSAPWSDTNIFQKFDPALGKLVRVDMDVTMSAYQLVGLENTEDPVPEDVLINCSRWLRVTMPVGSPLFTAKTDIFSVHLSTYDGILDFWGPSGFNRSFTDGNVTSKSYTSEGFEKPINRNVYILLILYYILYENSYRFCHSRRIFSG